MLEKAAGESRGETRDYISEQAGEADLIQVWDFALTPRGCVGRPAWYYVNKASRAEFTFWNCAMPRVPRKRGGRLGQRCEMGCVDDEAEGRKAAK